MIVTIHQPNFFPYYPFFQKMNDADIFVILKHCQFEKNNYQNRFNKNNRWYTMSVNKGLQPIKDKTYVNHINDWGKLKNSLPDYKFILNKFDDCITNNLSDTNINIIYKLKEILNIKTDIVIDYPTELLSTDRLVDLCVKHNANEYIAGVSGAKYLDISKFEEKNIKVTFQNKNNMLSIPIIDFIKANKLC